MTNLSANDYVGRMAVGRIWNGTLRVGQRIAIVREDADAADGSVEPGRTTTLTGTVTSLTTARALSVSTSLRLARATSSPSPGIPNVTIGDTITDPADPRPLPRLDDRRADTQL